MSMSSKISTENSVLSGIIRLSVSSYGDTAEELVARKMKLLESGIGRHLFGYEVSDINGSSDYLLTTENYIEKNPGCCGACVGVVPTLEELSFMLTNRKTGSSLIHIHATESADVDDLYATCIKIVVNAETKGVVRLDYPPSASGTHGDFTLEMVPVAVIGQNDQLNFIFRPSSVERNEQVTEIIAADGTGFVVAKVGPVECLLTECAPFSKKNPVGYLKRDHFCVMFLDSFLGRSWKQLLFSVSTVFFYSWLIHKAYGNKQSQENQRDARIAVRKGAFNCNNCSIC